jgi:hypothetical protein
VLALGLFADGAALEGEHVAGHGQLAGVQVEVGPAQRADLAAAQPRHGGEPQEQLELRVVGGRCGEQFPGLVGSGELAWRLAACRWSRQRRGVVWQVAPADREAERTREHRVDVADGARRQREPMPAVGGVLDLLRSFGVGPVAVMGAERLLAVAHPPPAVLALLAPPAQLPVEAVKELHVDPADGELAERGDDLPLGQPLVGVAGSRERGARRWFHATGPIR